MTARQRRQLAAETDPLGQPAPPTRRQCETSTADRARARIKAGTDAHDATDLRQLLTALGLDNPAEIATQLAHRH